MKTMPCRGLPGAEIHRRVNELANERKLRPHGAREVLNLVWDLTMEVQREEEAKEDEWLSRWGAL